MQCDHQLIENYLLDYMEGRLSREQHRLCDEALLNCAVCRATQAQALELAGMAQDWETQTVPSWHRTRFAVRPVQRQANWLHWGAIATSCFTLLLVVFQMEISTDDGLLISFGGSQREARLQAELASQLETFRAANAQSVAEQLAQFSIGQDSSNRLLLSEWLERSRTERRDDMDFLMTAWESQRFEDKQHTDERLSYLARNQIESDQYLNELMQNADYPDRGPL